LKSHYSPNADIYLEGIPSPGDGFIALSCVKTPKGAIRLASPEDDVQYAQILYHALRQADKRSIKRVFVVLPQLGGISTAIIDRLNRAAYRG
jgi:L-threonylcarbamoyladenylate synthase